MAADGDSTQSGGRTSTENGYQLKALSGGVKPLVILFCPERWRPEPAPRRSRGRPA